MSIPALLSAPDVFAFKEEEEEAAESQKLIHSARTELTLVAAAQRKVKWRNIITQFRMYTQSPFVIQWKSQLKQIGPFNYKAAPCIHILPNQHPVPVPSKSQCPRTCGVGIGGSKLRCYSVREIWKVCNKFCRLFTHFLLALWKGIGRRNCSLLSGQRGNIPLPK